MTDVLPFPTDRKRSINCGWLDRNSELPENVVVGAFEKPKAAPPRLYPHLTQTPEMLLLIALMTTMKGAQRQRLAKNLKSLSDGVERGGNSHLIEMTKDLMKLESRLPCRR